MNIKENHLHIEGANIEPSTYKQIIKNAKRIYKESPEKQKTFQKNTGQNPLKLKFSKKQEKFTFKKFLEKLYTAKLCLSSNAKIAGTFCEKTIESHQKNISTIGITPSIPSYFPHINKYNWYETTTSAINNGLKNKINTTLVIETKRSNLKNKVYLQNLEYLQFLNKNLNKNIKLAVGLCGDAEKNPLANPIIQKHYKNYIRKALKIKPDIKIQIHELEQKNPMKIAVKELDFLLKFLNKNKIFQVDWVHMCNLVKISSTYSTTKVKEILNTLKKRKDRIIICPTSNKILNNPFLLKNKEITKQILNKDIRLALGTDDPSIFGIKDIAEEYKNLQKTLKDNNYNQSIIRKISQKIKIN